MAWWTQAGLTTTIAHDARNGGGDRILNRAAANNPLLLNGAAITEDVFGGFWCVEGKPTTELKYNAQVTRPSAGACVALLRPWAYLALQFNTVDGRYLGRYDQTTNQWSMMDGNVVPGPAARGAWQCVAVQWSSSQYRFYGNGAWLDIARTHSSGAYLPAAFWGPCYPGYYFNSSIAALGVWSGSVTLALLQNIERMMRSELAATDPAAGRALSASLPRFSYGPQGSGPGGYAARALDTGSWVIGVKRIYFNGRATIKGVVTVENVPAARLVRLYLRHSGLLMAETWSAANGEYEFNNVDGAYEYFVVAHDHTRTFNAVVQDMLTETAP